jgi:hypothetical protein
MTSLIFQMTATGLSLPTAWLAPPPGLLPSNQAVKIIHVPITISATIALVIGTLFIVLFSRKNKDVFLEDKIMNAQANQNTIAPTHQGHLSISTPVIVRVHEAIQHALSQPASSSNQQPDRTQGHAPNYSRPQNTQRRSAEWRHTGQKLDDILGVDRNWDYGRNTPRQRSPTPYDSYYPRAPPRKHAHNPNDKTLNDDEKNSAYVPFTGSELDYEDGKEWKGHEKLNTSHISGEGSVDSVEVYGRIPFKLANKYQSGDAY